MNPELSRQEYIKTAYGRSHLIDFWSIILNFGDKPFSVNDLAERLNKIRRIGKSSVYLELNWNLSLGTIAACDTENIGIHYKCEDAPAWEDIIAEVKEVDNLYPPEAAEQSAGESE